MTLQAPTSARLRRSLSPSAFADISALPRSFPIHTRTAVVSTLALISGLASACSGPALTTDPNPLTLGHAGAYSAGGSSANAGAYSAGGASAGAAPYVAGGSAGAPVLPVTAGGAGGASGGSAGSSAGGTAGGDPAKPINNPTNTMNPTLPGWKLVWSDDFNDADGTAADPSKWHHDVGGDGYGNQELEYYTDGTANAQQHAGNLVITATRDGASSHSCWNGACQYTSARLLTSGKFSASYGRIESRIKIPTGQGMWPAFWMLGDNIAAAQWPGCGEIDIMEVVGNDPATVHGSLHGPGYSGGSPLTASTKLPNSASLADDFHVYSVEWAPNSVKFALDGVVYETRTPADTPPGAAWVYNHPFFMILNLAVGGQWPGSPNQATVFPAQMLVDYVRVYEAS